MALDSLNSRKQNRGKILRIKLKEEQYRMFLEFCRSQNTTPIRMLKREIRESVDEFSNLKEEGLIPEQNQLFLFEEDNSSQKRKEKDKGFSDDESQLTLF